MVIGWVAFFLTFSHMTILGNYIGSFLHSYIWPFWATNCIGSFSCLSILVHQFLVLGYFWLSILLHTFLYTPSIFNFYCRSSEEEKGYGDASEIFGENDVVVVVFPDHGSRYMSKIYSDKWMNDQGFFDSINEEALESIEFIK